MFPRNNFADLERDMVLEDINENLISEKSENLIYKDELANVEFGRCPICYDAIKLITLKDGEINPSPNITTTPCGHSFCYKCLNTHLENVQCVE